MPSSSKAGCSYFCAHPRCIHLLGTMPCRQKAQLAASVRFCADIADKLRHFRLLLLPEAAPLAAKARAALPQVGRLATGLKRAMVPAQRCAFSLYNAGIIWHVILLVSAPRA